MIGKKQWVIPEGYIPGKSNGPAPEMTSHETFCVLNPNKKKAHLKVTIYFSDRDPQGPYHVEVGGERTLHQRFNNLNDPAPIPRDTEYSSLIESDVPIIVQHTRLDSRQSQLALISAIAYPVS